MSKGIFVLFGALAIIIFVSLITIYMKNTDSGLPKPTLGIAPVDVDNLPHDTETAAKVILETIKKQYGNKLVIIFFYDGYNSQDEAVSDVKILINVLDTVEPYKSLSDLITYKIITSDKDICSVINYGSGKTLVCDKYTLGGIQRLGIDHIKLVALSPKDFVPTAPVAHGFGTVMSISTYKGIRPRVGYEQKIKQDFATGLGKSLGLFREYSDTRALSENLDFPQNMLLTKLSTHFGKPNCAPNLETAQKWWGNYAKKFKEVGFFRGCSDNPDYYYPQKNTLMSENPKGGTYGRVSEDYLRGVISCFYADKEAFVLSNGSTGYNSCKEFKKMYPSFWEE